MPPWRPSPEGPPLVLLAPKQATFQLERQLLADGALQGYTRLNIFSFERLARFVLDARGIPMPSGLLAEEGRVMVLRALLMRHEGELKLFRPSARRPGFAQQLSQLLGELQQHQFTPAKLRSLSARTDLRRELQDKLHDLALLLDTYTHWLAEHELQDGNRLLDAAPKLNCVPAHLEASPLLAISTRSISLWLDGFAEMTPQELDLLAAVVPFCGRATLAFCLENEPAAETSWLSIWSSIGKIFQQCRQRLATICRIAKSASKFSSAIRTKTVSPEIRRCRNWKRAGKAAPASRLPKTAQMQTSTPRSIRLAACANPEAEAVFAAREILRFVRARPDRFRDAAVLVRNLDGYHKPLARAFRRYGIPFFLDRRESVAHHPLAELTRSALRTVAFDWPHDDWFAALKAGFSPVDEAEIDRLENEALARGWHGAKWREPLQIAENPELSKFLERLREIILPPFQNFAAQLARWKNKPTGAQLADALRGFWSEMKVEQTLERWSLADPGKSAIRNPQSVNSPDRLGANERVARQRRPRVFGRGAAVARMAADFGSRPREPDRRRDSARARPGAHRRD